MRVALKRFSFGGITLMFARYDSLAGECGLGLSEYALSLLSRLLLPLELILQSADLLADCGSGANASTTDTASSIDGA